MARHRPAGVDGDGGGRVARVAGAVARHVAREGAKRGVRALLARGASSTATAAASQPHVAAIVAAVLAAAALLLGLLLIVGLAALGIANSAAAATCTQPEEPVAGTVVADASGDPPANVIPWLIRAANQPSAQLGVRGAAILAGIAKVESDFGRSTLPGIRSGRNSYGCCAGPFQFNLDDTWDGYVDDPGADADGDGRVDVYSFPDAAFAAARKLASQGAPEDWNAALLGYNNSTAYVQEVLDRADDYQGPIAESSGGLEPADPVRSETCANDTGGGGGGAMYGEPLGPLPEDALPRIKQIADWIEQQRYPYCWSGGHEAKPGPDNVGNRYCKNDRLTKIFNSTATGLDCSGAVRWLLTLTGYPDTGPTHSSAFARVYPRGPGRHVTIWSNNTHVLITIDGRAWGTSDSNHRGGPGWTTSDTSAFTASHPPGL